MFTRRVFSGLTNSFIKMNSVYLCSRYSPILLANSNLHSNNVLNFSISHIDFAKSKDKGKEKGSKKSARVEINPMMMSELIVMDKLRSQCKAAVETMKEDFSKNLSLRSSTGSIETIRVKFDGKDYELQELAQFVKKNPKTMVINFAAFPQAIPHALKAIAASGLNLNPQQDGNTLFVPVPKVTKEHRESLAKNAKAIYVKYRDQLRDVQNEFLKKAKKQKASEDLVHNVTSQIQKFCEQYHNELKTVYNQKCEELVGKS